MKSSPSTHKHIILLNHNHGVKCAHVCKHKCQLKSANFFSFISQPQGFLLFSTHSKTPPRKFIRCPILGGNLMLGEPLFWGGGTHTSTGIFFWKKSNHQLINYSRFNWNFQPNRCSFEIQDKYLNPDLFFPHKKHQLFFWRILMVGFFKTQFHQTYRKLF